MDRVGESKPCNTGLGGEGENRNVFSRDKREKLNGGQEITIKKVLSGKWMDREPHCFLKGGAGLKEEHTRLNPYSQKKLSPSWLRRAEGRSDGERNLREKTRIKGQRPGPEEHTGKGGGLTLGKSKGTKDRKPKKKTVNRLLQLREKKTENRLKSKQGGTSPRGKGEPGLPHIKGNNNERN